MTITRCQPRCKNSKSLPNTLFLSLGIYKSKSKGLMSTITNYRIQYWGVKFFGNRATGDSAKVTSNLFWPKERCQPRREEDTKSLPPGLPLHSSPIHTLLSISFLNFSYFQIPLYGTQSYTLYLHIALLHISKMATVSRYWTNSRDFFHWCTPVPSQIRKFLICFEESKQCIC